MSYYGADNVVNHYNERLAKLFLNQARSAPDCPLTACF